MDKIIDLDPSPFLGTVLANREFVEDHEIKYGTVVPVQESSLAGSTVPGRGANALAALLSDTPPGVTPSYAGVSDFQKAALVYFRGTRDLDRSAQVVRLVQLPLYYEEVKAFSPISPDDLALREKFAKLTGYVLIGPDECLAVLRKRHDQEHVFCEVYENNDLGVVRDKAGVYENSVDYHATPKRISELNMTQTDRALGEWQGEVFWWSPQTEIVSPLQLERMRETVRLLEEHLKSAPPERKASGAVVHRSFISNGDTGSPGLRKIRGGRPGWMTYPTSQDAWYYAQWINPIAMETLSYCEQDVTHVVCSTQEQFRAELADLARFHGRSLTPSMFAFGETSSSVSFDCLTLLSGERDQIKTLIFAADEAVKDAEGNWICPPMGDLKLDHPSVVALQEGESVALGEDAFQFNLLDPRAFDQVWSARAERIKGDLCVHLRIEGVDAELTATLANDEEELVA